MELTRASGLSGLVGKSATKSYWRAMSTVVSGADGSESVGVAPLNDTPRMGTYPPTKRSSMPPLGRLGLATNTKLTSASTGAVMRAFFSSLATVALWEYPSTV